MQSVGCLPIKVIPALLKLEAWDLIEFIRYTGLYLGLPVHVLACIGVISHSLNAKCRYLGILQNIYYSQACKVNIRHTNIII